MLPRALAPHFVAGTRAACGGTHPLGLAPVDDAQLAVLEQEEVPGVGVRVEVPHAQHHVPPQPMYRAEQPCARATPTAAAHPRLG
eukprot:scaffold1793_cov399-Prasinococcus_capsulatus_cf.AAC.2